MRSTNVGGGVKSSIACGDVVSTGQLMHAQLDRRPLRRSSAMPLDEISSAAVGAPGPSIRRGSVVSTEQLGRSPFAHTRAPIVQSVRDQGHISPDRERELPTSASAPDSAGGVPSVAPSATTTEEHTIISQYDWQRDSEQSLNDGWL